MGNVLLKAFFFSFNLVKLSEDNLRWSWLLYLGM